MAKITTAAQLAESAIKVAKNFKTLYVKGCFGSPLNASNKKRYTANNDYNKKASRKAMINAASADTFGFDCVCLVKGLLWGWTGDKSKAYGGATYGSNGVPDINADAMIKVCKEVSTDFSKIEVGEAVWLEGHIGVYVGNGLAVECTPKWKNNVQITACNCTKSGYNRRNWTKHGKLPYVIYNKAESVVTPVASVATPSTPTATPATPATQQNGSIKKGDLVKITGTKYYNGGTIPSWVKSQNWYVREVAGAKIVIDKNESGNNSINSPVDIADLQLVKPATEAVWIPVVGDTVNFKGSAHYISANSAVPKSCKGGTAKITAIYQLGKSKHPYHLVAVQGGGSSVHGWVDDKSFTKA